MPRLFGLVAALATLAVPAARAQAEPADAVSDDKAFADAARAWARGSLPVAGPRVAPPAPPSGHPAAYYVGVGMLVAGGTSMMASLLIMLRGTGYTFTPPHHLGPGAVVTGVALGVASPFLLVGGVKVLPDTRAPEASAWVDKGGGGGAVRFSF